MEHLKFDTLNVVFTEKSDGNQREKENRHNIIRKFRLNSVFIPNQKHTNVITTPEKIDIDADGIFITGKNTAGGVLTADCLPVVITDFENLAVVHAGWRGLVGGIIENAVRLFKGEIFCFIGPSAGKCCYEVGEDFVDEMLKIGVDSRYFYRNGRKITFSLKELAADKMKKYGAKQIFDISLCSICSENFYSYRKGDLDKRILTFAWLEE
ncbi:polyphenol oxidase family protein [Persephonella sp.]|jgi:YfiH family protein